MCLRENRLHSSFHSVSLSSDGDDSAPVGGDHSLTAFPMERDWTWTRTGDGETQTSLSKMSLRLHPSSPLVHKSHHHTESPHSLWRQISRHCQPQRIRQVSSTSSFPASGTVAIPHPPQPRSRPPSARTSVLDPPSILSQRTTTSRTSTSSRAYLSATTTSTPTLPGAKQQALGARPRYDTLFVANVRAHAPSAPTPVKR